MRPDRFAFVSPSEMKRLMVIASIVLMLWVTPAVSAQIAWRETNRELPSRSLNNPHLSDGVEIYGSNGAIIIRTPRRINVSVFTILGQNVSQAAIGPGTAELKLGTRGIYIVKIGNITQKVAL